MDPIDELIAWAKSQNIVLNGVSPKRLPGRGVGIIATHHIKVGNSGASIESIPREQLT
jgi:hypothetical protein